MILFARGEILKSAGNGDTTAIIMVGIVAVLVLALFSFAYFKWWRKRRDDSDE